MMDCLSQSALRRPYARRLPGGADADCVFRALVPFRDGWMGLGTCFGNANAGNVWSRLWRLSAGRWVGPVRPRLAGTVPVFLDMAGAGQAGSVWAVGFVGGAGIIALHGPVPR